MLSVKLFYISVACEYVTEHIQSATSIFAYRCIFLLSVMWVLNLPIAKSMKSNIIMDDASLIIMLHSKMHKLSPRDVT